jgi:hypothetical protein
MATIVLRAAKALPLTHGEVDANFTNLNTDKLEIGAFQLAGSNTRLGAGALPSSTGTNNTASGVNSLYSNTTGGSNTASGVSALFSNTTGGSNTASGANALFSNTTGANNTSSGANSLLSNTTGGSNTASGVNSLYSNTTGSGNIGIGGNNSAGSYSPVFNPTTENNRVVMGSTSVTNAYIQVAWTVVSDARDKTNFAPVPHGLSFLNALKPTAYQYTENRESSTPNGPMRYGFLAQDILELEGVNSVIIDSEDPDKLRYNGESLVPVLVNAVQELSRMVETLQAQVAALS